MSLTDGWEDKLDADDENWLRMRAFNEQTMYDRTGHKTHKERYNIFNTAFQELSRLNAAVARGKVTRKG